ncbi:MAG: 2-hydroxyacyl-CoA dehydratase, partial [Deltaproteobacteria bacterium]|nr:2-hydroxyacyl-CoA dehydratase [Deltaproteobacteria bacterium]
RVIFNEVQRQFSMPFDHKDIVDQYLEYTYPYDMDGRLNDIKKAIDELQLDGLIHYTQMFCYRQIYDIIIRNDLSIPILTLEGDRPGQIDGRTALRIETFVEMLKDRKRKSRNA